MAKGGFTVGKSGLAASEKVRKESHSEYKPHEKADFRRVRRRPTKKK